MPVLFGPRLVARRPCCAVFSAASIAVAVMGLVAALAIHAAVDILVSHFGRSGGLVSPDVLRAEQVLTAITISLVILAALTVIFAALATVFDARRASAVTLALGATPQQVRAGLVMAQVVPALPGAILGVPLGIGLFKVAGHGLNGLPPVLWRVAAVLGTVVLVAALTSVPARIGLRRPIAEMLQAEADVMSCGWQPLMPQFSSRRLGMPYRQRVRASCCFAVERADGEVHDGLLRAAKPVP